VGNIIVVGTISGNWVWDYACCIIIIRNTLSLRTFSETYLPKIGRYILLKYYRVLYYIKLIGCGWYCTGVEETELTCESGKLFYFCFRRTRYQLLHANLIIRFFLIFFLSRSVTGLLPPTLGLFIMHLSRCVFVSSSFYFLCVKVVAEFIINKIIYFFA